MESKIGAGLLASSIMAARDIDKLPPFPAAAK
jgi:hypothetical protein